MASFIELIWPLPGETLDSFVKGGARLIREGAPHIVIYPHLLLPNTPLHEQRDRHGFRLRPIADGVAEAQIVVETDDVDAPAFEQDLWFIYAVLALHNARALRWTGAYLDRTGIATFDEFYASFCTYAREEGSRHPFARFCRRSIADADYYDILNYPASTI